MRLSIAAAERTRNVVKVAASISAGPSANRHRIEFAAKQSMATLVKMTVRSEGRFGIVRGQTLADAGVVDRIWSANRAASSATPARKDEFILDNHGRPKKYKPAT